MSARWSPRGGGWGGSCLCALLSLFVQAGRPPQSEAVRVCLGQEGFTRPDLAAVLVRSFLVREAGPTSGFGRTTPPTEALHSGPTVYVGDGIWVSTCRLPRGSRTQFDGQRLAGAGRPERHHIYEHEFNNIASSIPWPKVKGYMAGVYQQKQTTQQDLVQLQGGLK